MKSKILKILKILKIFHDKMWLLIKNNFKKIKKLKKNKI